MCQSKAGYVISVSIDSLTTYQGWYFIIYNSLFFVYIHVIFMISMNTPIYIEHAALNIVQFRYQKDNFWSDFLFRFHGYKYP